VITSWIPFTWQISGFPLPFHQTGVQKISRLGVLALASFLHFYSAAVSSAQYDVTRSIWTTSWQTCLFQAGLTSAGLGIRNSALITRVGIDQSGSD
jgi:hypothetical protein